MGSRAAVVEGVKLEGCGFTSAFTCEELPHSQKIISAEEVLWFKAYQSGLWLYYVLVAKAQQFFRSRKDEDQI